MNFFRAPEGWQSPKLELDDNYPTEETLDAIRNWPYDKLPELMIALKGVWLYQDYFERHESIPGCWLVSTGGWSGHEDMLSAFMDNKIAWRLSVVAERRGGHYVLTEHTSPKFWVAFEITPKKEDGR